MKYCFTKSRFIKKAVLTGELILLHILSVETYTMQEETFLYSIEMRSRCQRVRRMGVCTTKDIKSYTDNNIKIHINLVTHN